MSCGCNTRIIQIASGGTIDLASTDFSTLTTAQAIDILNKLDFSQLTVAQCAEILACFDFSNLTPAQANQLAAILNPVIVPLAIGDADGDSGVVTVEGGATVGGGDRIDWTVDGAVLMSLEAGKLTLNGVFIDPATGIEFTPQAAVSTRAIDANNVIWINSANGHAYRGSVDLEAAGAAISTDANNIIVAGTDAGVFLDSAAIATAMTAAGMADLISADADNIIVVGTDGKLYASVDFGALTTAQQEALATDLLSADADNQAALGTDNLIYVAPVDFSTLTAAQVTAITEAIDFSQLTTAQQTALAAALADDLISADGGNALAAGTDGLLYVAPGGAPTIVSTDANNIVVAGTDGGAFLDAASVPSGVSADANNSLSLGTDGKPFFEDIDTDDQTATEVTYNNTTSGLTATDAQAAIDEVESMIIPETVTTAGPAVVDSATDTTIHKVTIPYVNEDASNPNIVFDIPVGLNTKKIQCFEDIQAGTPALGTATNNGSGNPGSQTVAVQGNGLIYPGFFSVFQGFVTGIPATDIVTLEAIGLGSIIVGGGPFPPLVIDATGNTISDENYVALSDSAIAAADLLAANSLVNHTAGTAPSGYVIRSYTWNPQATTVLGTYDVVTLTDDSQLAFDATTGVEEDITAGLPASWVECETPVTVTLTPTKIECYEEGTGSSNGNDSQAEGIGQFAVGLANELPDQTPTNVVLIRYLDGVGGNVVHTQIGGGPYPNLVSNQPSPPFGPIVVQSTFTSQEAAFEAAEMVFSTSTTTWAVAEFQQYTYASGSFILNGVASSFGGGSDLIINASGGATKYNVVTFEDDSQRAFNDTDNSELDITAGLPTSWTLCNTADVVTTLDAITVDSTTDTTIHTVSVPYTNETGVQATQTFDLPQVQPEWETVEHFNSDFDPSVTYTGDKEYISVLNTLVTDFSIINLAGDDVVVKPNERVNLTFFDGSWYASVISVGLTPTKDECYISPSITTQPLSVGDLSSVIETSLSILTPIVYTPTVNHTVTDFDIKIRRNNGSAEALSFDIQAGGLTIATTDLVTIGVSSTSLIYKWTLNAPFEFVAGTAYTLIADQALSNFIEATIEISIPQITSTGAATVPPSILFNGTEEVTGGSDTLTVWTYIDGTQRAFNNADNTEVTVGTNITDGTWTLCSTTSDDDTHMEHQGTVTSFDFDAPPTGLNYTVNVDFNSTVTNMFTDVESFGAALNNMFVIQYAGNLDYGTRRITALEFTDTDGDFNWIQSRVEGVWQKVYPIDQLRGQENRFAPASEVGVVDLNDLAAFKQKVADWNELQTDGAHTTVIKYNGTDDSNIFPTHVFHADYFRDLTLVYNSTASSQSIIKEIACYKDVELGTEYTVTEFTSDNLVFDTTVVNKGDATDQPAFSTDWYPCSYVEEVVSPYFEASQADASNNTLNYVFTPTKTGRYKINTSIATTANEGGAFIRIGTAALVAPYIYDDGSNRMNTANGLSREFYLTLTAGTDYHINPLVSGGDTVTDFVVDITCWVEPVTVSTAEPANHGENNGILHNGSWGTTLTDISGSEFTLPAAGKYKVSYVIFGVNTGVTSNRVGIYTSADVLVPNSVANSVTPVASQGDAVPIINSVQITITAATTYKLKGRSGFGTYTYRNSDGTTGANGNSKVTWEQLPILTVVNPEGLTPTALSDAVGFLSTTLGVTTEMDLTIATAGSIKGSNITISGNEITLKGGHRYELNGSAFADFTSPVSAATVAWVDENNDKLANTSEALLRPLSQTGNLGFTNSFSGVIEPTSDVIIKPRLISVTGGATIYGSVSYFHIKEMPLSTVVMPDALEVGDVKDLILTGTGNSAIPFSGGLTVANIISAYESVDITAWSPSNNSSSTISVATTSLQKSIDAGATEHRVFLPAGQNGNSFETTSIDIHLVNNELDISSGALDATSSTTEIIVYGVKPQKQVINTTDTPINDQSTSGYMDIGNMRIQWGTSIQTADPTLVTFPVPFGSVPVVTTSATFSDAWANPSAITTTGFNTYIRNFNGSVITSSGQVNWQAIGLKPQ